MTEHRHPDLGDPEASFLGAHTARQAERDARYPEHAKLRKIMGESHDIRRFLDWLECRREPPVVLCVERSAASAASVDANDDGETRFERFKGDMRDLMSEYFRIDPHKLLEEEAAMRGEARTNGRTP